MTKITKLLIIIALIIFAFLMGVKYSNQVKNQLGLSPNIQDEEVEIPNLSNQNDVDINQNVDENGNDINEEEGNSHNINTNNK